MKALKGTDAENVLNRILHADGWDTHQARRSGSFRAGAFFSNSNDLWNCIDLAGVRRPDGCWFIQVTTSSGTSKRRRKLEQVDWPISDVFRISIFETKVEPDSTMPRRAQHWFRIHDLLADGTWRVGYRLNVERHFLKAPPKVAITKNGAR